ncbi:facilitated trehalose transporter Tret1-like [Contarinia nasturtii]|uniref:facilitated trehalose transporter Tret1-like n=1 Tax=Contarinia nasturtii TaxID=265458 RepID=UPI0012D41B75|nr:facilitated trehalose transporter Tret1-like [Contarinia nasturtii]
MSQPKICDKKSERKAGRFRRILAQLVATTVKNFLLFNLGLCFSLPTIVIPALTGIQNEYNQGETLTITPVQASWLGALAYLVQPFGSILSALITDPLGRKRAMILVNIPFAIGWYMLYRATTVWEIFLGFAMQGLAVGLMEAPIVTYLGEICEPSVRGVLIGYTFIFGTIGMFTIYLMNTLMAWRTVCFICLWVPVFTAFAICFIPETMQWLLSKNRTADAEKSLRWLRGWVSSEAVAQEFNDLKRHSELSKSCNACIKQNVKCSHPLPTMVEKFAELKRKRTLKPLFIVISLFFLAQFSGILSMRPFMVQIFKAYESPVKPDQAATIMSVLDNLANITFMLLVKLTGKRKLYLFCLCGVLACAGTITWYGYTYLPPGYVSFDQAHHKPFELENKDLGYIPMVCLMLWSYFAFCGFNGMPWMFLSELFPFKSRGMASGVAAATNYAFGFFTKKTYYNLETTLSLPGASLLYTIICLFGLILTYNILPETENRSLEDIELHFSDNSKKITDRKIAKRAKNKHRENGNPEKVFAVAINDSENKSSYYNKGFELEKV